MSEERERRLILVADDDAEVREMMAEVLAGAGFRVLTAADGEEAVELSRKHRPALVVLDVLMPRMDGYTTLTRLRGHPSTRDIPVIVLTGQADPRYQNLSLGLGAVAHLEKPFTPGPLVESVHGILADRDARLGEEERLGDYLVEHGFITTDQREEARNVRHREGTRRLAQILLEMVAVSPDQLNRARAELLGVPPVEFREATVDLELARMLPEELLRRRRAFPVRRDGDELAVVMVDPTDRQAIAELEDAAGAKVNAAIAFRDVIARLLDRAFPPRPGEKPSGRPPAPLAAKLDAEGDPTGVRSLYALLLDSLAAGASEILIEPGADEMRVRARVEGRLVDRGRLPRAGNALVGRLRLLAGVVDDPAPLVTYTRTRLEAEPVELELAFTPTLHGEAVTVKLWRGGLADPDHILGAAVAADASDIFMIQGTPPTLKVDGLATPLTDAAPLGAADLRKLVLALVPEPQRKEFDATGEADLSFVHGQFGRFRVNCYRAMGATGMVLRRVKTEVPNFEALELPPILGSLAMERQGLILVVGATGSGKSTTAAAMLDHRNTHAPGHIVTIEDPVEFIHGRKQSVVSQREVGVDTESYLVALQKALRQAPDVIFVGELRERETVATALHAAETGHLVLSTLHATNATSAVERLLNFFPAEARDGLLMQISLMLRAVVAQRLVPRGDGKGRIAALEILLNTSRMQALIRRGELDALRQAMEEGVHEGLQTLDQGLLALYQQKKISQEDALRFADSPNNVRLRIKGIR